MMLNKPNNFDELIKVDYNESYELQLKGYIPLYRDDNFVYFVDKDNIKSILKEIREK